MTVAVLSDADRRAAWAEMMRLGGVSVAKADLRAAFDAIDAWVNANAATINAAIPQPARSGLTTPQKALLLALVIRKRYDVGA